MGGATIVLVEPSLWRNWQLLDGATPLVEQYEVGMYTDALMSGSLSVGPIQVFVNDAIDAVDGLAVLRLRVHHFEAPSHVPPDVTKSDSSAYHGGEEIDEIAALLSLVLGARYGVGGFFRTWGINGDPDGTPYEHGMAEPYLPPTVHGDVLPRLSGSRVLSDAESLLSTFGHLTSEQAILLVRAARLYAQAIWVANSDANLAWIQLVGAVETAAKSVVLDAASSSQALAEVWPELFEVLRGAPPAVAEEAADLLIELVKSRRKFRIFLGKYSPDAPTVRPHESEQADWDDLKKSFDLIYTYRSKALHEGNPFPVPMCEVPRAYDSGVPIERPDGHWTSAQGGLWMAKDTPMLLATFEYIVRHALLAWWSAMVASPT